jgi:NADPH-dependent 2,4-dienoyl-CoA reductase/sulfur reductase-like enzyme
MLTSAEGVWACGDCVESRDRISGKQGLYMLWNNARAQGKVAGANAGGDHRLYSGSLNVTTVNLFHHGAASVGSLARDFPEGETRVIHREGPFGELWLVFYEDKLVGVQTLGRLERFGRLLGVLLRGEEIRKGLAKDWSPHGIEYWHLGDFQRELHKIVGSNP